jgi:hypothetical protein
MLDNYDSDMETVDFISMRESSVCLKKKLVKPSNANNNTSIFYDELNDKSNDKQKNNEKNNGLFSFCNII